jgi:hypothetical protein
VEFEQYLVEKKIESASFQKAEPERWAEWKTLFDQMSPGSFTAQKLYLINPIRRKYPLPITDTVVTKTDLPGTAPSKPSKPVFKPKIS